MRVYNIEGPDGRIYDIEGPDGASDAQVIRALKTHLASIAPVEGPKPETGLLADVKASARNLLNIGRTGLGALTGDTTAAAMEGAKRQEEAAKAYTPGFQPQKIVDKFNSGEYFGAAGEAISQVPSAIAGLLPSVGQEIGSAALGRLAGGAAGALAGPAGAAVGSQIGQYAVPLIVNAIQALGSQAQEKVQTQIEAGEKPDVNALELAPYAAANAAANLVGTRIAMPGIFKKAIGQRVAEESGDAARAALMAKATKTAGRGTMAAIGYGTGRFAIGELPTEIFQDVIDRAAIGKPLADDEAITQYRNTALNMALAAPLGGGFALKERSNARDVTAQQKIQADAEANLAQKAQQDAAAAQLEADKQTLPYAKQAEQEYFAAEKNKADLLAQIIKGTKDKPLTEVDKQANKETVTQLKENAVVLTEAAKEYRRVKPLLDAAETDRMQAIETAAQTDVAQDAQKQPYFEAAQATLPGMDAVEQPPAPAPDVDNQAQITDFATKQQEVRRLLEYNQTAASDAASDADTAAIKQLSGERKKLQTELDYVTNKLADLGGVQSPENVAAQTQQKLDTAKKKLKAMAGEGFDPVKADRLVAQIDALEEEIKSYGIPKNTPIVQRSLTEPGYIEGLRAEQRSIDKDEADAATNLLASQKPTVSKDPLALLRQSNEDLANANIATTAAEREAQKPFRSAEPGTLAGFQALRTQEALPETEPETLADIPAIEQLVATLPKAATVTPGQIQQGLGFSPQRTLNDLQAKFQIARLTGNKEAQATLVADLQDARKKDTAARGTLTTGLQSALGFGTLEEGRAAEANADMQADKQNNVLVNTVKILNKLRFNRIPGTLTLDPEKGIKTQFDKAKETYAAAHAAEINGRRKAFGIPEMATWEAADARARVMEGFNELQNRWNVFESRHAAALAIQEQMRNNVTDNLQKAAARLLPKQTADIQEKITKPATHYYEDAQGLRTPLPSAPLEGKRIAAPATLELKGTPYRASNEKQDALNLIEAVLSTVKTRTRAVPTTEKVAAEKVGSLQDIAQLFAAEKSGGVSARTDPATQALLEQLAEALPKINDPDIITLARQQAQQVLEGNLPSPNAVLELQAAIKFQEREGASGTQPGATLADLQRTSAQPQLELFEEPTFEREFSGFLQNMGLDEAEYKKLPTTSKSQIKDMFTASGTRTTPFQTVRSTPELFQKLLGSKTVAALKGKIKKTNGALKKQTQDVQNALSTAITQHNRALQKAKAAKETIALVGGEPVWFAPALREVVALETALQNAPMDLAELRSLREGILMLQGDPAAKQTFVQLVQESGLESYSKKAEQSYLDAEKNRADLLAQIVKGTKDKPLTEANKEANQQIALQLKEQVLVPRETAAFLIRETLNQLNSPNPFGKEIAETERHIADAQKMVLKARARFNNLLLIENASAPALLKIARQDARAATKEAEKAKADLETARQAVADATAKPDETTPKPTKTYAESIQAGREGLDLPGVRVTEDTVALRKKITGLRSEIATASAAIKKEKDPVKKAALQEELAVAEAKLATVDIKTPRRITEIKTAEEVAFDQQAETTAAARARAVARERAEAAAAAAGEVSVAPKLPATQKGAVAYGKNNQVTQTGAPSATAQMGSTSVAAIEALAAKRAELAEVQQRQNFLRTNNKDKVKGRLTATMQELNVQEVKLQKETAELNKTLVAVAKEKGDTASELGRYQGTGAIPKYENLSLSRGKPTNASTVESVTAELAEAGIVIPKQKTNKPALPAKLTVLQSVADFIELYPTAEGRVPRNAKGLVYKDRAFLFADNIGKGEALGVMLHEVGAHIGFRNFFNKAQYNAIAVTVKNWAKRNDGSVESKIGKAALARVEAAETTADQIDDEIIAYAVEEAIKAGIQPVGAVNRTAAHNWLKMVVDAFKKALAAFGINPSGLKAGDLVNFAYGCAQLELRGTWHGSDATFTAFDTAFAGEGEGAFDRRFKREESLGVGPYVTADKDYAEYYQAAVTAGKASNATGYGDMSYQQFRDLDDKFNRITTDVNEQLSFEDIRKMYESNLLTRYLNGVLKGDALDPEKNKAAVEYISDKKDEFKNDLINIKNRLKAARVIKTSIDGKHTKLTNGSAIPALEEDLVDTQARLDAVSTLDVSKIKGLKERPQEGNLYRTLDDVPDARVYQVNSNFTVGDRPKLDALLEQYGDDYTKQFAEEDGNYPANMLLYKMRDVLGVDKAMRVLKAAGIDAIEQNNEGGKYVERAFIDVKPEILGTNLQPIGQAKGPLFSRSVFIGSSPDALTTFRGNFLGLAGRVQYVDAKAAREEAFAAAEKAGKLTNNELFQANYFMRMADKVSQAVGQFLSYGPISIVRDPKSGEYGYARKAGATMVRVAELVEKSGVKDGEMMLTRIAAGQRANAVPNGWERLAGKKAAEAKVEYENAVAFLQTNPTAKKYMDAALLEYKQFNGGLLDFAEQHDLLSAEEVARLKKTPFVPFYRVEDGVVKLYSDSESAIRIGDISNDPELVRMLGSEQTILPIFTSAVQNTYMLTRLSMHNKESLESSNALFKAGFVSKMGKGQGLASKDTVHYRLKGEPHFATIDSDTFGIPAELIVAGMSGIKTTIPILVRAMGYPADLVRKFVTRAPVYPFRQLVRDPINAAILSGVDGVPILNALKELGKMRMGTSTAEEALSGGLVVSSNVFSGNERDMQQFIESIATGKNWWKKTMGALDTFALQTDAATRATVYQDGLKKGLSEFRAQLNAAESQNFGRHGLSPSMHYLSTLIPFFNSQVQGLDLLYRALKGKLPFSEQLELKRKLYARGAMLTVGVMAYAAMMQDDEAYKKATPQERYSNLFMPLPGLKEPLKVPIPYEVGTIFVALPQMIIDLVFRDTKAREALKGMGGVLAQSVPGVVPAAAKPVLEAFYGSTTVGPIESEREKKIQAEYRFKDTTPEALRIAGSLTGMAGVSPIMLTHLVRGYTGGLGVALLQVFDPLLGASGTGEKASVPLNKQPLIGGLFQSAEGRGFIDAAYDHMERIQQARQTYVNMVERGQRAEAVAFAQRYANELAAAATSGQTFKRLGELYAVERKIRAHPTMTTAQKDTMLDRIKVEQNRIAVSFEQLTDRTTRP